MKIRKAVIVLALVLAPLASVVLTYYGPIWFLKAEIAEATDLTWKWMVRAYGVTPAMQDCVDDKGYLRHRDFYWLWDCGGGWTQPPHPEWTLPAEQPCFDLFAAAQNHLISMTVAVSKAKDPDDPYYEPLDLQTVEDLGQVSVEDLSALQLCLEGESIGGDITRYRR